MLIALLFAAGYMFVGKDRSVAIASGAGYTYPGYSIEAQQPYEMQARVLGRKDYTTGREADLSPVDLALGWGPMADLPTIAQIDINQRNRFYFWRVEQFPIPRRDIEHHSANVHIIPANPQVARALEQIALHDEVELRGQLVNVRADDGWRWRSSLTFQDTGKGACELLWLESVELI